MSKRGNKEILNDIKEAINRINRYILEKNYQEFLSDTLIQDAVVRNLEIIGEAVKNLQNDVKEKNKDVPWKKISGIRDRLIHHYFGVNFEILWAIIKEDLINLSLKINNILKSI